MAIVAVSTPNDDPLVLPSPLRDKVSVHNDIPPQELTALLTFGRRVGTRYWQEIGFAAPLDELMHDGTMNGFERAWRSWDTQTANAVSFTDFARICIRYTIRNIPREYGRWSHPTPSQERWLPPAECVRPEHAPDSALVYLEAAMLDWLHRTLTAHRACLSPSTRQALDDLLADMSMDQIADRDGISYERAKSARRLLFKALRRHIGLQETTCSEERLSWRGKTRGYRAHNRKAEECSYAVAN